MFLVSVWLLGIAPDRYRLGKTSLEINGGLDPSAERAYVSRVFVSHWFYLFTAHDWAAMSSRESTYIIPNVPEHFLGIYD